MLEERKKNSEKKGKETEKVKGTEKRKKKTQ